MSHSPTSHLESWEYQGTRKGRDTRLALQGGAEMRPARRQAGSSAGAQCQKSPKAKAATVQRRLQQGHQRRQSISCWTARLGGRESGGQGPKGQPQPEATLQGRRVHSQFPAYSVTFEGPAQVRRDLLASGRVYQQAKPLPQQQRGMYISEGL